MPARYRTCVACRRRLTTDQLVRLRARDGALLTGSGPGRGAWVGPSRACVELAARRSAVSRALRAEVNAAWIARLLESWPTDPPSCPHEGG